MRILRKTCFLSIALFPWTGSGQALDSVVVVEGVKYPLYPSILREPPSFLSPTLSSDGSEIVVIQTQDNRYLIVPVTLKDHAEYECDSFWSRGKQTGVDKEDFPTLALTGLHSELELASTLSITGRSIAEITEESYPGASSGEGFMALDETIISVLAGDNRIVKALGLTHPVLARPLMQLYNLFLWKGEVQKRTDRSTSMEFLLYNGSRVLLVSCESGKGWQESLFLDEIKGFFSIDIQRSLSEEEERFLKSKYFHLSLNEMDSLIDKLTNLHFGEMSAYLIMRYGFYEGHTKYRADPIVIARLFGLKSLAEIEAAFPGRIPEILNTHFTSLPWDGGRQ